MCEVARLKGSTVGGAFNPFYSQEVYMLHPTDRIPTHIIPLPLPNSRFNTYNHAPNNRKRQYPLRHPITKARDSNPKQPPYPYPRPSRCPIQEELTQLTPPLSLPFYPRKRLCLCRRSINPAPKSRSSPCESLARFIGHGGSRLSAAQYEGI